MRLIGRGVLGRGQSPGRQGSLAPVPGSRLAVDCPARRRAVNDRGDDDAWNPVHPERSALRHRAQLQRPAPAGALYRRESEEVKIFLIGDAASCAKAGQKVPQGYYSIERMLKAVINKGGQVKACGTCSEARGIKGLPLLEGVVISSMAELAKWTVEANKVVTF